MSESTRSNAEILESTGSNAEILKSTRQFCKAENDEGLKCNKETCTNESKTSGSPRRRHLA